MIYSRTVISITDRSFEFIRWLENKRTDEVLNKIYQRISELDEESWD